MSDKQYTKRPLWMNFMLGGISGCSATLCVHPLDTIRIQIQVAKEKAGFVGTASRIYRQGGMPGLYAGLSAGLVRQLTYGLAKFGVYSTIMDSLQKDGQQVSFMSKLGAGLTAGSAAAIVGNPAEVALVRMAADGRAPVAERRGYTNVFNALTRVTQEEGVQTLWRGTGTHIIRAALLSAAQLATFTEAKERLAPILPFESTSLATRFCATLVSGFVATCASLPMDVVKTRLQNMKVVDGIAEYKSMPDCVTKIIRNEGFFALWKGFPAFYIKLAPYTTIALLALDYYRDVAKEFGGYN